MKKLFYYLFLALLPLNTFAAKAEPTKMWIENKIEEIQIVKFKSASEKAPAAQRTIKDPNYIYSLVLSFNQLPEEKAPMMVKMGPNAKLTELTFIGTDKTQKIIRIFNNNLQLQSTGFYSPNPPEEKEIVEEIEYLLNASYPYNKAVPYYQNAELKFEHFKMSFVGSEDRTPRGVTASTYVDTYRVVDNEGHSQNVEIRSGQLPPTPSQFKVKDLNFTLYNYKGRGLMGRHLVVEKN